MRCKHNSPRPQLGSRRHLVCLSITRSAKEPSCVSSKNAKCPPWLPHQLQPAELLCAELLIRATKMDLKRSQCWRVGNQSCRRLQEAELLTWVTACLAARQSSTEHGKRPSHLPDRGSLETSSPLPNSWILELARHSPSCRGHQRWSELPPWRGARDSPPGVGHVLDTPAEPPSWPSSTTQE